MPGRSFLLRTIFFSVLLFVGVAPGATRAQQAPDDQTTADETFQLNIQQKRIAENNFRAGRVVSIASATKPPVALRIGAEIQAESIVVTLKSVFGDVRFRGSLEKIRDQINQHRMFNGRTP